MEQTIESQRRRIEELEDETTGLQMQLEDLRKALSERETGHEAKLRQMDEEAARSKAELSRLRNKATLMEIDIEAKDKRIREYDERLKGLEHENSRLGEHLAIVQTEAEESRRHSRTEIDQLKQRLKVAEQRLGELSDGGSRGLETRCQRYIRRGKENQATSCYLATRESKETIPSSSVMINPKAEQFSLQSCGYTAINRPASTKGLITTLELNKTGELAGRTLATHKRRLCEGERPERARNNDWNGVKASPNGKSCASGLKNKARRRSQTERSSRSVSAFKHRAKRMLFIGHSKSDN